MDDTSFFLATVSEVSSSGVRFVLDGQTAATQKSYKMLLTGRTLAAGARVIVMKQSGTYVVLGQIGTPS